MVYVLALGAALSNALTSVFQRMGVEDAPAFFITVVVPEFHLPTQIRGGMAYELCAKQGVCAPLYSGLGKMQKGRESFL